MNRQIRRVSALALIMILALCGSSTYFQYFDAAKLRADPRNVRTFYQSFNRDRGAIIVGGEAVASSKPVKDDFGYQRVYQDGSEYAPVTGYFSVVFGLSGIESAEDDVLQGTSDSLFWSRVRDLFTGKQPMGGAVELTIDPAAQDAAWEAMGDQRGAVVALDPKTGEILALVSTPSYDPAVLAGHDTGDVNDAYQELIKNKHNPLWNRAIAGNLYSPGSTFKLITAAAALESGEYTKDSVIEAPSRLPFPNSSAVLTNMGDSSCSPTGEMTLNQALAISCNTGFAKLGMDLGAGALREQAEKFGFGQKLSVPLTVTPSVFPGTLDDAQTGMSAIGQFDDRVTPLQMAMVASAIANRGVLRTPHLVRTERGSDLQVVSTTPTTTLATPISPDTADQLKEMMVNVVRNGSGGRAAIGGVTVGGKTGTAEKAAGEAPDNWYVAFGEAEGRSVAVAVVVEDGGKAGSAGTGGTIAGPVAQQVMKAVLRP
jgi:peptidoglycan glycosyltransferase